MAINPTTGLYDVTGGDTSATVTRGLNDNFTALWNRDELLINKTNNYILGCSYSEGWDYKATYIGGTTTINGNTYNNALIEMWCTTTVPDVTKLPIDNGSSGTPHRIIAAIPASATPSETTRITPTVNFPSASLISFTNAPKELLTVETYGYSCLISQPTGDNRATTTHTGRCGLTRWEAIEAGARVVIHHYIIGYGAYTPPNS